MTFARRREVRNLAKREAEQFALALGDIGWTARELAERGAFEVMLIELAGRSPSEYAEPDEWWQALFSSALRRWLEKRRKGDL